MNPALRSSRMPDLPLAHHYIVCWPPCSRSGASGAPNISPFDPNSGVTRPDGKAWGIGTGKDHQGYQPPRSPGVQARAIELLVAPDVSRRVCTWSDRTWRHLRFIKESAIAQRSRLDCWSDGRATTRLPTGWRRPGLQRCPSLAPDGHASLKRSGLVLMQRLNCRSRSFRFVSSEAGRPAAVPRARTRSLRPVRSAQPW
jgi:hypothetical protein